MNGTIQQVNVSAGGIPKLPIAEGRVTLGGIEGDHWAHLKYHGGPLQKVLLICFEAIEELRELGFAVYPGALGENLTTRGLDRKQMRAGQQYRAGTALLELTKVRVPCNTLDRFGVAIKDVIYDARVKRGDHTSEKWARSGFYARVVEEGVVRPQDTITLVDQAVGQLNAQSA